MHFAIINAHTRNVLFEECADLRDAQKIAGIDKVDHGVVAHHSQAPGMCGIGITVYEYGLFVPPEMQVYFTIARRLYAGNAVLYGFDKHGESIDLDWMPAVLFLPNASAVMRNIQLGLIQRPTMSANGVKVWEWPEVRAIPKD